MNLHESDLKSRLARFLGRKQMPRRLEGKQTAMDDEIAALVAVLGRNAPRGANQLSAWWPRFEAQLGEVCGSMWPTEREVRDAAQEATRSMPQAAAGSGPDMRPIAINARRMQRGEAVGEGYLWGIMAVEMIAEGLIDRDTMTRYRSAAFLARKAAYGDAEAQVWEADAKASHLAAKAVWAQRKDQRQPRDTAPPDKGVPYDQENFAA